MLEYFISLFRLELEAGVKSEYHFKPHVSSTVTQDLDKVLYRCSIAECEKVFSSKSGLLRHMKGHNKGLLKCTRCSSFYSTREKFEEHNKLKHCRSLHKCKTCDSGLHTAGSLKCHIRACHTNTPNPFPCFNCHKSFTTLRRLAEHANFHLGAKPHSCKFCQQPYYRHDSCRRHEKICLTRKDKKKLSLKIELALCDLTNIKCTFAGCDKKFSTKFNLYRHIRSHNQKLFKCSKCTQYFVSAEDFKEHNELKHSLAVVCHQCGKTMASSSNLKRHAKLCVAGEKVHCDFCPKVFTSREGMLEHRNLHLGATPYSCKHCQRNYSRYDSCKRHEKNCQSGGVLCRYCGCTFSCKTSMVDHIAAVHENQRFKCDACGVTFKYRSSLHKHKKRKGH